MTFIGQRLITAVRSMLLKESQADYRAGESAFTDPLTGITQKAIRLYFHARDDCRLFVGQPVHVPNAGSHETDNNTHARARGHMHARAALSLPKKERLREQMTFNLSSRALHYPTSDTIKEPIKEPM